MRLLDTYTGQFVEKDPRDTETKYAILSHTWDSEGEQTFQELMDIQKWYPLSPHDKSLTTLVSLPDYSLDAAPDLGLIATSPTPIWDDAKLSAKVREACIVARESGYRYIWIDSCCIDKTSSSELSEAINSMYYWYARAEVCYAFLADVPAKEDPRRKDSRFRRSRWFTRGWTLQELIAPVHVAFLSKDWTVVGSKSTLADVIIDITDIDYDALLGLHPPSAFSVAKRFSWASRRQTTRAEDRAYSLLGLFDINMSTLYGEGDRAFRRLQEEIMKRIPDQSLFAWTHLSFDSLPRLATTARGGEYVCSHHLPDDSEVDSPQSHESLLAPSLDSFVHCGKITALFHYEVIRRLTRLRAVSPSDPQTVTDYDYNFTPHGIRTQLPVIRLANYLPPGANLRSPGMVPLSRWYLVILGCEHEDLPGYLLGRVCHTLSSGSDVEFLECGFVSVFSREPAGPHFVADLFPLVPATLMNFFFLKTVYMDHYPGKANGEFEFAVAHRQRHEVIVLTLAPRTCHALQAEGYTANKPGPDLACPDGQCFTFSNRVHCIMLECQCALGLENPDEQTLTIEGHIRLSGTLLDDPSCDLCQIDGLSTLSWTDSIPWSRSLGDKTVVVRIARDRAMTMQFGIDFLTKDHYSLEVMVSEHSTATASPEGGLASSLPLLQACKMGWEMLKEIPAWLPIFAGAPTRMVLEGHQMTDNMDSELEAGQVGAVLEGLPGDLRGLVDRPDKHEGDPSPYREALSLYCENADKMATSNPSR
ncbi:hypothetical protein V8D89_001026 [Ganoderma adspersum]